MEKLTSTEWGETCGVNNGSFYRKSTWHNLSNSEGMENWYPHLHQFTFPSKV